MLYIGTTWQTEATFTISNHKIIITRTSVKPITKKNFFKRVFLNEIEKLLF